MQQTRIEQVAQIAEVHIEIYVEENWDGWNAKQGGMTMHCYTEIVKSIKIRRNNMYVRLKKGN